MSEQSAAQPAAVLWDFDGTLVDTEPYWFTAEYQLAEELGGEWNDEHSHILIGSDLVNAATYMLNVFGRSDLEPRAIASRLVELAGHEMNTRGIIWRPGARELLAEMRGRGVRTALVSMSYQSILDAGLEQLPENSFDVVVAGDQVSKGKPDPEPYLVAAEKLGVDVTECFVIEDSPTGTAAGTASGAIVFGVRNLIDLDPAPRRILLDSLDGVDFDQLCELATEVLEAEGLR